MFGSSRRLRNNIYVPREPPSQRRKVSRRRNQLWAHPPKPQVVQKSPSHRTTTRGCFSAPPAVFRLAVARFRPRLTRHPPWRIRAILLSVTPLASVAPCCGSICGAARGVTDKRIVLGAPHLRRRCSHPTLRVDMEGRNGFSRKRLLRHLNGWKMNAWRSKSKLPTRSLVLETTVNPRRDNPAPMQQSPARPRALTSGRTC